MIPDGRPMRHGIEWEVGARYPKHMERWQELAAQWGTEPPEWTIAVGDEGE